MKSKNQLMKTHTAAIYARVSSQKQKEGETIDSQVTALHVLAHEKGYKIPKNFIFLDNGVSGSILQRPALDELRDIIRAEPLDTIFIYSPDRLSRNYTYQLILLEEFRKYGVKICFLKSPQEADTPEGKMLAHMQGVFAEYERALILDRSRRGRFFKAKQNDSSILPCVAYGYGRKKNGQHSLVYIKEDQASVVREIFRLFVKDGLPLLKVAEKLSSMGIKTPKGNSMWHGSTVRGILMNHAYIGNVFYGKTERCEGLQQDFIRHCKSGIFRKPKHARRIKPESEWLPIDMPQIVCESDFEIAQEILKKNAEQSARNTREPGLLQGLIICAECGEPFYKRSRKYKTRRANIYHCRSWNRKDIQKCSNPSIIQENLDQLVFNEVFKLLKNPSLIKDELSRRAKEISNMEESKRKEIVIKKAIFQLTQERDRLLDAYQGGLVSIEELRKRNSLMDIRKKDLDKSLVAIQASKIDYDERNTLGDSLNLILNRMQVTADKLSFEDKRKLVRLLVEKVTVRANDITITHCISPRMIIQESGQLQTDDRR